MHESKKAEFDAPRQRLPREAYFDAAWYAKEIDALFDHAWVWAATEGALEKAGDFITCRVLHHPLFVVRDAEGGLRAFHNICRHRGCELVEGRGNLGTAVRCPYHRWTYSLTGALRGVPNEKACFGSVPREPLSLHAAAVGTHRGMVYVNPNPGPPEPFEAWIAGLDDHAWPHRLDDGGLRFTGEMRYQMRCNWKVFYENAVDGYHLGYLHEHTLGKLYPHKNVWRPIGRHAVWYSTEREGPPQASSILAAKLSAGAERLPGHEAPHYPGVVVLFPLTVYAPNPWGFYISVLEPTGPETTNLRTLSWVPEGFWGRLSGALSRGVRGACHPQEKPNDGEVVRLADLKEHPLESGNFQLEDMWICEKIQRNVRSPKYAVGPMAHGPGAESPVAHFQQSVLDYLDGRAGDGG